VENPGQAVEPESRRQPLGVVDWERTGSTRWVVYRRKRGASKVTLVDLVILARILLMGPSLFQEVVVK
jgi:hypothetical protein